MTYSQWWQIVQGLQGVHSSQLVMSNPGSSYRCTMQTLHEMRRLVRQSLGTLPVAQAVQQLGDITHTNLYTLGFRVWNFTQNRLVYIDEPQETLVSPDILLHLRPAYGDCDDFAMVDAVLLLSLNIPAFFVADRAHPEDSNEFSHVYVMYRDETGQTRVIDSSQSTRFDIPATVGLSHGVEIFPV